MADEAENEEVSEITDEESLDAAGKLLAGTAAVPDEEEAEEATESEEEASVEDKLGISAEDKRSLGRVPSLQSKTDSTASKVENLENQIKSLVETFQKGLDKPLKSEELTDGLTSERGVEVFDERARVANEDIRKEVEALRAQQAELKQQQEDNRARS